MIKEYINDSILNTHCKYIAHGVNNQDVMRSGVAKVLFEEYPEVKKEYHRHNKQVRYDFLGSIHLIDCKEKLVFNCYTQECFGYYGIKYVSYDAIESCFENIVRISQDKSLGHLFNELAIPKIGCGLAGGNWNIVEKIINEVTGDKLDVYVYYI